jgi:predicted HAD superfamily Cof-like phosphohydrolase
LPTCRWENIRTKCFPKTGSLYFNYEGYFSVILLSCSDADAVFTAVHVGDFGKNSDGAVFRACALGEMLEKEELHIPILSPDL